MTEARAPDINITLDRDVSLADIVGKPLVLICEMAAGTDGKPILRTRYPYVVKRNDRTNTFRVERQAP